MLENANKTMGAFIMILSDPNRKLREIICKPAYVWQTTDSSFCYLLHPF